MSMLAFILVCVVGGLAALFGPAKLFHEYVLPAVIDKLITDDNCCQRSAA